MLLSFLIKVAQYAAQALVPPPAISYVTYYIVRDKNPDVWLLFEDVVIQNATVGHTGYCRGELLQRGASRKVVLCNPSAASASNWIWEVISSVSISLLGNLPTV